MQWLLELETDKDPITTCRLMNIFRRKGVNILTLSLVAGTASVSLRAVVETAESEVAHLFNFLRRTEGVQYVTCYRHEPPNGSVTAEVDPKRLTSAVGALAEHDSSRIIHTSKPGSDESGIISAKTSAPIETITVN